MLPVSKHEKLYGKTLVRCIVFEKRRVFLQYEYDVGQFLAKKEDVEKLFKTHPSHKILKIIFERL
jgi:hypothetical protein